MRNVNLIILHCSASDRAEEDDITAIRALHTSPKTWEMPWGKYKTHGKAFSDVGYHYFIRKDGLIQKGRDLDKIGAHCKGKNKSSIGICLSGRKKFTHHQFKTLANIILNIEAYYDKVLPIKGHNEFSKKDCPVFSVSTFLTEYL